MTNMSFFFQLLLQLNTNSDLEFESSMESFVRCCFAAYPHFSAFSFFLAGILQHPDGTVLKQLQPPPRGPRELQFYNMVTSLDFVFHYIFLTALSPLGL